MRDTHIAMMIRSKLVAFKVAGGSTPVAASKWADDHLKDAIARVRAVPKGIDPFAGLKAWAGSVR